jgi:hypothetical protein
VRGALTALLDASDQLRDHHGHLPDAESAAMAELDGEKRFRSGPPWGDGPVQAAHNQGQLLLTSSGDIARALVWALSEGARTVYAHTVLARAVFEHAQGLVAARTFDHPTPARSPSDERTHIWTA